MTNNKFTDEEVIKGLNELSQYTGLKIHIIQILKGAIDLINCQKAKIIKLEYYNEDLLAEVRKLKGSTIVSNIVEHQRIKKEAKAEAYKEFAERLKLHSYIMSDESQTGIINMYSVVTVNQIDNLLKEMVGEKE